MFFLNRRGGKGGCMDRKYFDEQHIDTEEMAEIKAIIDSREHLTELSSGEELRKAATELMKRFLSVKASFEILGFTLTKEMEKLILARVSGEITLDQFMQRFKDSY